MSTLVEMVTHDGAEGSTENTVLGPFYVPGSPPRARGESMLVDPDDGDRVVIRGTVTDIDGAPIAGATLDCWQNATAGFYAVQQPGVQSAENLRGIYTTDADGTYEIRTVRPVPYPIPSDGPVGDLLKAHGRAWMRPGHTHMWVRADGLQGPHHPRVRRGDRPPRTTTPCSASATASCAASRRTTTASWRRRSTSCWTAPEARRTRTGRWLVTITVSPYRCSWRGGRHE